MQLTESFGRVLPAGLRGRYRWLEVRNAAAILTAVAPDAMRDVQEVLGAFQLTAEHLLGAGGSKSALARELDEAFRHRGWRETHLQLNVEGVLTSQPWHADDEVRRGLRAATEVVRSAGETHKVDNFRDRVAIEVEWNAKDGNLDRDLSAFRALYDAGVIDVAVLVTRHHASVHHAANHLARVLGRDTERERFSTTTTTSMEKLRWRLARGDAGGCPVLAVGISAETYTPGLAVVVTPGGEPVAQPVVPPLPDDVERAVEAQASFEELLGDTSG